FGLFGRSANFLVAQPYAVGNFHGTLQTTLRETHLSGMLDTAVRFAINLNGGKAMPAQEFVKWKQKTLIGASIKVIIPTGQYDPNRLVNWGVNRWAFKPEIGISHRRGDWVIDGAAGVWFFTRNKAAFTGGVPRSQKLAPIGSLEGHISYDIGKSKRLWASLDGNFWFGGTATLAGVTNPATKQTSSRLGGTFSFPLNKQQSIKTSYSNGVYGRFGGNYQNLSISWQYSWIDKPK
ncbi:MAG TPA: transporter, partial [Pyrinomonadaceae bacterium]|nr:transporter [Pyrinomonadaceae bacterium]